MRSRVPLVAAVSALALAGVLLVAVGVGYPPTAGLGSDGDYQWTSVTVADENGTALATVRVRVADTYQKRYTGLSDTESLGRREGMLFVHPNEATHTYVMRRMDFPLDMLFVDANGTVTTIHHAPVPEDTPSEDLVRYRGRAKYVLEVPAGFANETGVEVGDCVSIPDDV
ncbi:MAG: DUF192 domain-containing protein [Haloferacaceae archaeon]